MGEKDFKKHFSRELLNALLSKYEQSQSFQSGKPGKQRPQVVMSKSSFHSDYTDEMDFVKRQWMNEVLINLEDRKILSLHWAKFREMKEVERIYLNWEMIDEAYLLSGRMPLRKKLNRLYEILAPLANHPWDWIANWTVQALTSLQQGKTVYLDIDSPSEYEDLVRVLNHLPTLGEKVASIRLFSQHLFHDSKHLEGSVLKKLISVVKQASGEQMETDEEWLDLIGLTRNPQYVYFCGPLQFKTNGGWNSTEGLFGGVGLSHRTIELMTDITTEVRRIITIENLTSYHQWIEQRERYATQELVIYTGGFPHRSLQQFLKLLSTLMERTGDTVPILHWGDIDLGGIRIFEFIKNKLLPNLKPLWMDTMTLRKYEQQAATITDAYSDQIAVALEDLRYKDWKLVLHYMLQNRIRLEQEATSEILLRPEDF